MSSAGMPDPMAKRLGYAIKRAQHALRTRMDEALRPLGITAPQYAVLSAIELDPGISNAELARAAFVTPQTMQGIVANLERNGLLRRSNDPEHGRILRGELTASGRRVLRQAHADATAIEAVLTAGLSADEVAGLAARLIQWADALAPDK
jgi:DNA-binding MarR family transcriptional regulator